MIDVGIIGATGYAGVELIRILHGHPQVHIRALGSVSFEGQDISDIYPSLAGICPQKLLATDEVIDACQVIFASVPHGVSEEIGRKCVDQDKLLIDLGADFRLTDPEDYKEWYKLEYKDPELHKQSVYSIPELHREKVKGAKIIGNPGCYPTSIALGLFPALKACVIDPDTIVIDSKSGVTGAGRGLSQTSHYPDCNEAFSPYKIASHRHTPEIEQTISQIVGRDVLITFVPHLLPVNRGIVSTIYSKLKTPLSPKEVHELYAHTYQGEQFVRVMKEGQAANLKNVRGSNYCDISLHVDTRTNRLIVVSTIDNMVKGAAGQAIQNMNLALGFPEDMGLHLAPLCF
ncbi:N-acetyl-gamma-glutamyl-phosphate reductase [Zongyangia hominis]|uniref:N-acetyl-gamma-glutamyl-phosphate reductase n=1 Tax=Zongyangia hominis TaxID=2763677 RepID=A0A926ECI1_9FIRM|nr:N-acetyl-gamma-glutamyl-phosphate reductase [Zongyangia hominis]MBC8570548.1 N-acetyl-gamma-glutamyl-phosphate reductase [Zongyangia hominis]